MERRATKPGSRVTTQQLSTLVSFLETTPGIANNAVKGPQTAFWKKVAKELNDLGPVIKDTTSWKRVWFDYKCSVKKRVRQLNENTAAGLYPKQLSPIQQRVAKLIKMEIKKTTLTQDPGSGSEDTSSDEANGFKDNTFDADDSNPLASMIHDASDYKMSPIPTRTSPRRINACQKRLEKLPNLTVTKQRLDKDPLENGTSNFSADEESNPTPFVRSRKKTRYANFHKALETNEEMIAAMTTSLTATQELTTELRAVKKSCDELSENLSNVNSTLRELMEVLKRK